MSSSDTFSDIPPSRDGTANWAADTDPVGPVTPELALVDPGLTRGETDNEVTMSSMQFGDGTTLGADPADAPLEPQPLAPMHPMQPFEPLQPLQPVDALQPSQPDAAPIAIADMRDVPLGTLVFRAGLLPEERLEEALQEGMRSGKRLGEVLLERAWVSEIDLGRLLAGQKGLPFVEIDPAAVDPAAPPLLQPEKARLHGALPIGFEGGVPVVAVADPSNDLVVENVRRALACEPVLVVAARDALHRAINHLYGAEAMEVASAPPAQPVAVDAPPVAAPEPAPAVEIQAPPAFGPRTVPPVSLAVEPAVHPAQNGEGVWLGAQTALPEPFQALPEPMQLQPEPVEAQPEPMQSHPEPVHAQPQRMESQAELAPAQPEPGHDPEPGPAHGPEPIPHPEPVHHPEPVPPSAVAQEAERLPQPESVQAQPAVLQPEPVWPVQPPQHFATPEPPPVMAMPAAPAPVIEPEPAAEPTASWAVVLRLTNDERLELGTFASEAEALEHARAVVTQVASDHGWPFVAGRFIRPDAIVSVDLVQLVGSKWLGSSARAAAWAPPASV